MKRGLFNILMGAIFFSLITGCSDPVTRHKVLTTFFDGVPELPTLDKLCKEKVDEVCTPHLDALCPDYEAKIQKAKEEAELAQKKKELKRSVHPPFGQKNCRGCHVFAGTVGFVAPKRKLCFVCHKNFIKGRNVHGPVAVGDCLACHLPHDSKYTSLLRRERSKICQKCHKERRIAENMHRQVIAHKMACVDCHDPHSGNAHYFLK